MRRGRRNPLNSAEARTQQRLAVAETRDDKWRGDSGWTTPTLGANYTAGTPAPRYKRDAYGGVWVQGYVSTTFGGVSGDTVFTLPAGMRPSYGTLRFAAGGTTNADVVALDVQTDGAVKCYFATKPGAFSLDPIHFMAEQ